jgi:MFS family permease
MGATSATAATADQMRTVFLWAAVPGAMAMIALALTREPPRAAPARSSAAAPALPVALKRALLPITLFAFANATDAFILVKAARLGASPLMAPIIWLVLHLIKASTAAVGGRLADRYGKRNALAVGWTIYAATWGSVGVAEDIQLLLLLACLYGSSHGLVEGAEKALIAELAHGDGKGKAFGAYNMLIGLSALLASTSFGAVWDRFGSAAAFMGSAAFALLAAVVLIAVVPGSGAQRAA